MKNSLLRILVPVIATGFLSSPVFADSGEEESLILGGGYCMYSFMGRKSEDSVRSFGSGFGCTAQLSQAEWDAFCRTSVKPRKNESLSNRERETIFASMDDECIKK